MIRRRSPLLVGIEHLVRQAQDLASKQQSDVRAGISAAVEQVPSEFHHIGAKKSLSWNQKGLWSSAYKF